MSTNQEQAGIDLDKLEELARAANNLSTEWVNVEWAEKHFGSLIEAKFVAIANPAAILELIALVRRSHSGEKADDRAIEDAAKAIYARFPGAHEHPWVECGNSNKQDEARLYARAALAQQAAAAQPADARLHHARSALWDIGCVLPDSELRQAALDAVAKIDMPPAAVAGTQQAAHASIPPECKEGIHDFQVCNVTTGAQRCVFCGASPVVSAAPADAVRDTVFLEVLDTLHNHLPYPTEACAIVQATRRGLKLADIDRAASQAKNGGEQ